MRLKQCNSLECALAVVTEEINFMMQYYAKNKTKQQSLNQNFKPQPVIHPGNTPNPSYRFGIPQQSQPNKILTPNQNFKFGIPHQPQHGYKFGIPNQQNNFRPNLGSQNIRYDIRNIHQS